LPDEDLDALVQGAQVKKFDGGETLFAEGDAADGLYLLRRGSVTISRKIGGHDIVLSYVAAGNYVGEMALMIDESLCIRCNNCEKACADVHEGTSRLNREAGPTYAQIHVPTSCRHCEHPHCMKDCPPDAINRAPNGEVYIRDTCIGCANCERNCPYGVIQMAPLDPNRRRPALWQWLLWGA